jgi:hypothetical protein
MKHLTFAEQQAANKADRKNGIIMTVLSLAICIPVGCMVIQQLFKA